VAAATETAIGARPLDMGGIVREAGLTALVIFALAFGLVGFEARDVSGGIAIVTRFDDVAAVVVIGFFGRVALILLREHRPGPVAIGAPLVALAMLVLLLSETLFGPERGGALKALIPFDDPIVVWGLFLVTVILAIRAGLAYTHQSAELSAEAREAHMDALGARVQRAARLLGPVLLVLAIALPFLPIANRHILDIGILVVTYIMLGWGLNIVVGLAGLLDLGYVAFYAVGAYSFALLATMADVSFWVALPFAGLMAATAGVILGFPVLRLRGDYLAIVTLGFGEMVRVILLNWY